MTERRFGTSGELGQRNHQDKLFRLEKRRRLALLPPNVRDSIALMRKIKCPNIDPAELVDLGNRYLQVVGSFSEEDHRQLTGYSDFVASQQGQKL